MSEQSVKLRKETISDPAAGTFTQGAGPRLSRRWLLVARAVWVILAIVAVAILVAALPHYAARFLDGQLSFGNMHRSAPGAPFFAAAGAIASLISALISLGLSALLFRHRFNEPIAILLTFFLLGYGVVMSGPFEFAIASRDDAALISMVAQSTLLFTPMIALLTLFPNGRFVPGWTRWLLLLSAPWNLALLVIAPFDAETASANPLAFTLVVVGLIAFYLVGIYAQIYRYRRTSTADERRQTRWAVYGFGLWTGYVLLSSVPYIYLSSLPPAAPLPWWAPASELGWWLSLNILPVCLTLAVTRYRLWNIDVVINRTLVYAGLTATVLVLYALVVGGMGLLFRTQESLALSLLATGLAALLFHPLRMRLQRGVNRMMYGERDEPFEVLARLGERLEGTLSPDLVYPTIVETVSQALKLPYVAVAVWRQGELVTVESYGRPVAETVTYPLSYRGESVGQLQVARRAPGEPFGAADERILHNLARQAGAAVHAVQLMADLQESRQRLVTTREEERRRLRRDLHDGLGPQLASQLLTVEAIEKLLLRDPERARALLHDLKAQSQHAVHDIRRLVYELRPPALDDLGLVGALREGVARQQQNRLQITVEASSPLPPLPAAVEVAAYRVAQEALTNVVRHARATMCNVQLSVAHSGETAALRMRVQDDGCGLPAEYHAGVGLQSMRERAAELGGTFQIESEDGAGVCVTADFPLSQ